MWTRQQLSAAFEDVRSKTQHLEIFVEYRASLALESEQCLRDIIGRAETNRTSTSSEFRICRLHLVTNQYEIYTHIFVDVNTSALTVIYWAKILRQHWDWKWKPKNSYNSYTITVCFRKPSEDSKMHITLITPEIQESFPKLPPQFCTIPSDPEASSTSTTVATRFRWLLWGVVEPKPIGLWQLP